jgi:hypothetical protein
LVLVGGRGAGVAVGAGGGGSGAVEGVTDLGTTIFSGSAKKSMAPQATLAETSEARRSGYSFMTTG